MKWIEYDDSEPAIRKVGDDQYELIWKIHEQVLCVSVLTEEQITEVIDHLEHMMTLPPNAHRQQEIIYHFPRMNTRTTG